MSRAPREKAESDASGTGATDEAGPGAGSTDTRAKPSGESVTRPRLTTNASGPTKQQPADFAFRAQTSKDATQWDCGHTATVAA